MARKKGQTLRQRYSALDDNAMPKRWEEHAREVYGEKSWDALESWQQKAEFVRQVVEGKWTGKISEGLYKFIREAIDYLKGVAGFEKADPRFKAHVQEIEARIEAARERGTSEGDGSGRGEATGEPDITPEEMARLEAEYRQSLRDEARTNIKDAGGVELLDAMRKGGGLPTDDPVMRGELQNIRDAAKPSNVAGYSGTFNVFRKDAPKLDALLTHLREQGFDFETPGQMLDAIQRRMVTKQPHYGFDAAARTQSGMVDSLAAAKPFREWLKDRLGIGNKEGRSVGQPGREAVSSGRENASEVAGVDPVTGVRSWLEVSEPGKTDGGEGEAMDAVPPPDGRDPGAAGLEAGARSDAGERTGTAAGRGGEQQQRVDQAAWTRGLAVKSYVGDVAAASVDVGSPGQLGDGAATSALAARKASQLLRLTLAEAREKGFAPEAVAALQRIREQVPLISRDRLVQSIDAEHARNWHSSDESYSASEGGSTHIEHHLKTRTLDALFDTGGKPLRNHLATLAAKQKAGGTPPRLELIGVGNEGAAFRDRESGMIYKFHPGTENASAYAVTRIEHNADGTTEIGIDRVPLTDAIRRYERQNLVSVATPTEVAGVTPEGILVTKQRELSTSPETTFPEIERMMESTGGMRVKEDGTKSKRQVWAVPDGEGNWMVAADLKPANVLRDRATGEPRLTDGVLAPITPEVLKANPQLADLPATNPDALFAAKPERGDTRTGSFFAEENDPFNLEAERGPEAERAEAARRISVPRQEGDNDNMARAREFVADQRAAGKTPRPIEVQQKTRTTQDQAKRALADHVAAEQAAARSPGLARPDTESPLAELGEQSEQTPGNLRSNEAPSPAAPDLNRPLAVGDRVDMSGRGILSTVSKVGEKSVTLTLPSGKKSIPIPHKVALAKRVPDAPQEGSALPTLRRNENQGDLLSRQSEDLRLVGEESIDQAARQQAEQQAARESAEAAAKQDREQGNLFQPSEPAPAPKTFPPELLAGVQPGSRRAALLREGYANGELSRDPATGLWSRRSLTARKASELVTPATEKTLSERRTQLDKDKAHLAASYQEHGQPVPENLLGERETTLKAREDALARYDDGRGGDTLAAAKPEGASGKKPGLFERVKAEVARYREQSGVEDSIAAHFDAAKTIPGFAGKQAGNLVRGDIKNDLDRQAAGAVVEAGGSRARLQADLAKVEASPDKKLAAKYAPAYRHALANLDRLQAETEGARRIDAQEDAAAEAAGLPPSWQSRVKHIFDDPLDPESSLVADKGFGSTPGFKTSADAIAAGVDPKSIDLADQIERRVRRNQELIHQKQFQDELFSLKAADGKPILGEVVETSEQLNQDGSVTARQQVPEGYKTVQVGRQLLTVHNDFADAVKAFYDPSAVRASKVGRAVLKAVAIAKHYTLIFDTFHVGRMGYKQLAMTGKIGYGKGLSVLEHTDADLGRMVEGGEIDKATADFARKVRPQVDELLAEGMNVGRMADNFADSAQVHLPVIGGFTRWVFEKFSRGAMLQSALVALDRNAKRFPELSRQEVVRRTAKEINETFGNLGKQGLFKSATMQDLAKMALLAPNWTESQLRSELRGLGQFGRAVTDAATGKGVRLGNVAQAMAAGTLGLLAANQIVNLFTKGTPTWENEEGHRLDAWLPGGPNNRGFWFSPLELAAEFTHTLGRYTEGGESGLDAATHIASNKLSPLARGVKDLVTGEDWKGEPFGSTGERFKAAAIDALPSPLPLGAFIQKDPTALLGYSPNKQKGSVEKQLLNMTGLKVEAVKSARSQMYKLAEKYRPVGSQGQQGQPHAPGAYSDLKRTLRDGDEEGARAEIVRLITQGGKTSAQVTAAAGWEQGKVEPEKYTGSREGDIKMLRQLPNDQRRLYVRAKKEHETAAMLYRQIVTGFKADQRRALALASEANKRGNRGLSRTLGKTTAP